MAEIHGTDGDDFIRGGVSGEADVFYGHLGDDTIEAVLRGDTVYGGGGDDEVKGIGAGAYIYLEEGDDTLVLSDETTGEADQYDGGIGTDTVRGSFIVDITNESQFRNFENVSGVETDDLLIGNSGSNFIRGHEGADTLVGGGGADTLDGGLGVDTLQGGAGDDVYRISSDSADVADETAGGGGFDTVEAAYSIDISSGARFKGGIEGLTLLGSENLSGSGNSLGNLITGNAGSNVLTGAGGDDTLVGGGGQDLLRGGSGDDTYVIDSTADRVNESAAGSDGIDTIETFFTLSLASDTIILGSIENLTLTGAAAINGSGNSLANAIKGNAAVNVLSGGAGDDTLDGGAGADSMRGGAGADTYFVDNSGDRVDEAAAGSGGIDTIVTARTYALDNPSSIVLGVVENLTLTGTAALNGAGSALANIIRGNAGANTLSGRDGDDTLDGSSGADRLIGGLGNDTFYVDVPEDAVVEAANGGTDTILSSGDYTLSGTSRVEFLTLLQSAGVGVLTGNQFDQTITGNAFINELHGGGGADTLIGLGGIDLLYGGTGDDTFRVEGSKDIVREAEGEGYDSVVSTGSFTLAAGAEVEFLGTSNAAGSDPLQLVGNEFKQTIVGNAGANILNSRGGGDILQGRGGDDFYHVNAADKVQEAANQGFDTVNAHENYVLAAGVHVERLQVNDPGGVFARNLTGNAYSQELVGGAGANVLNGLGGADTMTGGAGADTFVVDNVGDVVVESASDASRDTIRSSVTRVLDANVENLVLVGAGAINGKGNALNNSVGGTAAGNVLTGMEGSDTLNGAGGDDTLGGGEGVDNLYGGLGRDVLSGGAGADYFGFDTALNAATNVDRISDFSVVDDTVVLSPTIFGYLGIYDGQLGLDAKYFRSGTAAADADDRIVHNSATGAILFDRDGVGGAAAVQFASVTAGLVLTNGDFFVL